MDKIGNKIRCLRKLRGWSQETLAFNANINPAFLGQLERGLKSPTVVTLKKIAEALDVSLAELFTAVPTCEEELCRKELNLKKFSCITKNLSDDEVEKITSIVEEIIRFQSHH